MIDNFAPQPYPLECSPDGETWRLVVGWRERAGVLLPATVRTDQPSEPTLADGLLRYRVADTRPSAVPTMRTVRPSHGNPA